MKSVLFLVVLAFGAHVACAADETRTVWITPRTLEETATGGLLLRFDFDVHGPDVKYAVIQGMQHRESGDRETGNAYLYGVEIFTGKKWDDAQPPAGLSDNDRGMSYFVAQPGGSLVFSVGDRKGFEALRAATGKPMALVLLRVRMSVELIETGNGKVRTVELKSSPVALRATQSAVEVLPIRVKSDSSETEFAQLLRELQEGESEAPALR